jgi:hypothetical protein
MFIILKIRNNPTKRNKQIVKLAIPRIFCIAIISLIYQINAHKQLDIHYYLSDLPYMFQRIMHHPHNITTHTHQDTGKAQQDKLSSPYNHTTDPDTVAAEKEHILPRHLAIKQAVSVLYQQVSTNFIQGSFTI